MKENYDTGKSIAESLHAHTYVPEDTLVYVDVA